jgi:hypothetical protein
VRNVWEDQRRFPLQIATVLSQQFAAHGLQFFKVNKSITHVSVARPHYLDLTATPVSDGVKRIVDYINANPKCGRRQLVEALSPTPLPAAQDPATAASQSTEPSPEQTVVIADLHWLIHQGHVIEFANGLLETAKKPVPKPARPQPKPPEKAAEPSPATGPSVEASIAEAPPASQSSASPENEPTPPEPAGAGPEVVAALPDGLSGELPIEPTREVPVESQAAPVESPS